MEKRGVHKCCGAGVLAAEELAVYDALLHGLILQPMTDILLC